MKSATFNDGVLAFGGVSEWNKMKIHVVTPEMEVNYRENHDGENYRYPTGCLWFRCALGNKVFVKTKNRVKANEFITQFYGENKYKLNGVV